MEETTPKSENNPSEICSEESSPAVNTQGEADDTNFIATLLKETERELGNATTHANFPLPGQGAKSDVLFNAIGVFARKGISETTVQDLLEAANISRRTFYKYFKNKVDVLESIYQLAAEMLTTRFNAERASAGSLAEFVMRCVDLYFDYHASLGPLVRMMTEEARRTGSPLAQHREALIKQIVSLFDEKYHEVEGAHLDPLVHYALIWSMESASINLLTNTSCTQVEVDRYKAVMRSVAARVIASDGDGVRPDLPTI